MTFVRSVFNIPVIGLWRKKAVGPIAVLSFYECLKLPS